MHKIKSSGFIGFHEPIEKVKQLIDPIKYKKLLDFFSVYEHSDHDNEINMDEVLSKISDIDFKDKSIHYYGTTVMTIFYIILGRIRFLHKIKLTNQIIFFLDRIFYNIFCRSKNRFGPTGVVVFLQKNNSIKNYNENLTTEIQVSIKMIKKYVERILRLRRRILKLLGVKTKNLILDNSLKSIDFNSIDFKYKSIINVSSEEITQWLNQCNLGNFIFPIWTFS